MAEYLPRGPLSAYLGVRNSNQASDLQQFGLMQKFAEMEQARQLNEQFRRDQLGARVEGQREAIASREAMASQADARQREFARARLDAQENTEKLTHEFRMAGLKNAADKLAETERHNKVVETLSRMRAESSGKADPGDEPLKPTDLLRLIDKDGNHPPVGSTMKDIKAGGYKVGTTQEINMLLAGRGAEATVSQLEKYVDTLWGKEGEEDKFQTGIRKRLTAGASLAIDRAKQSNPDLNAYESFGAGTLAPLIRAIGEKGALSDKDVERALNLIPKTGNRLGELPDTSVVARQKMKQLRQWFTETLGKNVGAPSPGEWSDEKEQRYQELLRKRGGS